MLTKTKEETKEERLTTTREAFAWLATSFKSSALEKTAIAFSAGGRAARAAGFYFFAQTLNTTFDLGFSEQAIVGLCLVAAPDNIGNEFAIFKNGTIETITQKIAEAYVTYSTAMTKANDDSTTFNEWCRNNPSTLVSVYNKSFFEYSLDEDVTPALERRMKQLGWTPSQEALREIAVENPMQSNGNAVSSIQKTVASSYDATITVSLNNSFNNNNEV